MFEIYFSDLTPEAQERLLAFYNTIPNEENWDIFPIAILEPREGN